MLKSSHFAYQSGTERSNLQDHARCGALPSGNVIELDSASLRKVEVMSFPDVKKPATASGVIFGRNWWALRSHWR